MNKGICGVLLLLGITAVVGISQAENPQRVMSFPLPGSSGADSLLQKDALVTVLAVAGTMNPSCKPKSWDDMYIVDTRISRMPKVIGSQGNRPVLSPWEEVWVVNACGTMTDVTILFIPDTQRGGTSFKISFPKKEPSAVHSAK